MRQNPVFLRSPALALQPLMHVADLCIFSCHGPLLTVSKVTSICVFLEKHTRRETETEMHPIVKASCRKAGSVRSLSPPLQGNVSVEDDISLARNTTIKYGYLTKRGNSNCYPDNRTVTGVWLACCNDRQRLIPVCVRVA
jgi:hypothetical protein